MVTADRVPCRRIQSQRIQALVQEQIDKGGNPMLFVVGGRLGQQYFRRDRGDQRRQAQKNKNSRKEGVYPQGHPMNKGKDRTGVRACGRCIV